MWSSRTVSGSPSSSTSARSIAPLWRAMICAAACSKRRNSSSRVRRMVINATISTLGRALGLVLGVFLELGVEIAGLLRHVRLRKLRLDDAEVRTSLGALLELDRGQRGEVQPVVGQRAIGIFVDQLLVDTDRFLPVLEVGVAL